MSESTNLPPNAHRLPRTNQLEGLMTIIRDKTTSRGEFIFYADRLIRLIIESGLNVLPTIPKHITTETGEKFQGVGFEGKVCGVSILRAGEAMESALRECLRSVRIGKVLVQRNEQTGEAHLYYAKLPEDIHERFVLLLDPMLATGGSAIRAIEVLLSRGVQQEKIVFLNVLSAPEGLNVMYEKYPKMKIITGWVDRQLDQHNYIVPGLGDFGDRYFA
ncbi:Uracil phosphoribosyltransferase [Wallemia ichthyophaga EXF-994]|uniref:uracil phosphoribosyltransferase n=1 Tax=Wallemia ichthyophaga (strain EXF-994 / CBS 113033) TaxID=1299270 RepID=R9AHH5_WALI9|nr:Uracil phosphoribosyltransferase [Wallemia ichthyophaga EXF-994]EOR01585.1 Uracil phosphoribosyltransferase [Wallemia ichthyophaga EXF-994]